jgi:hypothetical protein
VISLPRDPSMPTSSPARTSATSLRPRADSHDGSQIGKSSTTTLRDALKAGKRFLAHSQSLQEAPDSTGPAQGPQGQTESKPKESDRDANDGRESPHRSNESNSPSQRFNMSPPGNRAVNPYEIGRVDTKPSHNLLGDYPANGSDAFYPVTSRAEFDYLSKSPSRQSGVDAEPVRTSSGRRRIQEASMETEQDGKFVAKFSAHPASPPGKCFSERGYYDRKSMISNKFDVKYHQALLWARNPTKATFPCQERPLIL